MAATTDYCNATYHLYNRTQDLEELVSALRDQVSTLKEYSSHLVKLLDKREDAMAKIFAAGLASEQQPPPRTTTAGQLTEDEEEDFAQELATKAKFGK